ncbi:Os05g0119400 [Oryza sativa Japonica Group]|uniref:Os05g0119400 protein n=1 Tax=Oryza sativa subsp. japonica TaxID=39947 RepID=A0A0P0WHK5_ORYSJ|nr:hypothetical protein EE612_026729 [Oryza sativa]BAS92002.1 Os05g0119400 [Oryza sativa Japonica Group]
MLQRAASNAYSWWWASHIRTKQSKWLDNNLHDMEDRVKFILFLLGEEADSFAKRAEMYYKRRPEVISSVEEAYRAYRALAERYDHISGELHKANHTIATAFPDQVQYSMLEEDDDNLPKAFTAVDPRKIHKSTVEGLMKKKKGEKSGLKDGGKNSGDKINKENAQEEISRLQKEILVLQTQKEFLKSSYESGMAKYWDLEKQINDMQEEVCYFQEEFNESAVLEDNEARALMTATALKSCQETIIKLQEQQKLSFSEAMVESERVRSSRDKLKNIMKVHGKSLPDLGKFFEKTDSVKFANENVTNDGSNTVDVMYSINQEKIELQATVDKIKEYFQKDSEVSVVEMADKIDALVNKVVDLELMVSSQTAQLNRLCLENTELEKSLHELEEEKPALNSGPGESYSKFKQAEEDLIRVQNLVSSFHAEGTIVHSNFTETITRFRDVSDMLLSPLLEHHQDVDEVGDQEENMIKLQQLLMNGLQDKEKVLLTEYTSILRNYKNEKRKLTEVETKNQERLNEMSAMISELRSANSMKDEKIRSLLELLNAVLDKDVSGNGHQMNPTTSFNDALYDTVTDQESLILEDIKLIDVVKMENASPLEEKFRQDIDALLEENLEFWMKFSTSFQQIQGFQTKYEQLQPEIGKLTNKDKLKTNNGRADDPSAKGDSNAIEKRLRELKIELQVWLEQNAMLKGELQYRFASLCSIQEEIEATMEMGADPEEGAHFTSYQAAKFQGEVMNMKQENNKVADELQSGLDHIKGLQAEIEKVIEKIVERTSLSEAKGSSTWKNAPSRTRVPLRLFLFPAKKKKPSLLACVNPALQKQHSDMVFFTK